MATKLEIAKKAKKDPVQIMASIIRMQRTLYRKDIAHWKQAREEALDVNFPRRYLLNELYDDVLLDGFIFGQIKNRILRVKNTRFAAIDKNTKQIDQVVTELLQKTWVRTLIEWSLESKFHGHSLVYFNRVSDVVEEIKLVPREHVCPEHSLILKNPYDVQGTNWEMPPFSNYCLSIGNREDLGMLEKCAPLYILKKHSWQNWDEFEEIFGIPIRVAKTASRDKRVQAEIQKWLREMGSASYGLFPEGTDIDIKENARSDAYQVFNEKRKAANEELAILINGQFESSIDSGSRAKAESVIASTQDEITKDDIRDIEELFSDRVFAMLRGFGFPIAESLAFKSIERERISLKERVEIYSVLDKMGLELDSKQIEEEIGIKILGKKKETTNTGKQNDKGERHGKEEGKLFTRPFSMDLEEFYKVNCGHGGE